MDKSIVKISHYFPKRDDLKFWLAVFIIYCIDYGPIWGFGWNTGVGGSLLTTLLGLLVAYPHLYLFDNYFSKNKIIYFSVFLLLGFFNTSLFYLISNFKLSNNTDLLSISPSDHLFNDWLNVTIESVGNFFLNPKHTPVHTAWIRNLPEASIIMWSLTVLKRRKTRQDLEKENSYLQLKNDTLESEIEYAHVMYNTLQRRMEPHFLFHLIKGLGQRDLSSDEIQNNVEKIRTMMAYIIVNSRPANIEEYKSKQIDFMDELTFINLLIDFKTGKAIKQGIYPKIDFSEMDIDTKIPFKLPPMILSEFIDNAFKYGVEQYGRDYLESRNETVPLLEPFINFKIKLDDKKFIFIVENMLPSTKSPNAGFKEGLGNIRKRLEWVYADKYDLKITNNSVNPINSIYRIELNIIR